MSEQTPVTQDPDAPVADLQARAKADRQDWSPDRPGLGTPTAPANGGNPIR